MQTFISQSHIGSQDAENGIIHKQIIQIKNNQSADQEPGAPRVPEEQPVIQQFYSQTEDNKVIKVTKIMFGLQAITLTEKIFITPLDAPDQDNNSVTRVPSPSSQLPSQLASKKRRLSIPVKIMLKNFKSWIHENRAELSQSFQQIEQKSTSDRNLRQNISQDSLVRQSFISFAASVRPSQKQLTVVVSKWAQVFRLVQRDQTKSDEILTVVPALTYQTSR